MKVEMKNTSFKRLVEFFNGCKGNLVDIPHDVNSIVKSELQSQYDRSFKKYKNEEQKFQIGDNVKLKDGNIGRVIKVSRRRSGKYYYVVKYSDFEYDIDDNKTPYDRLTNPLTTKNLVKVKRKTLGKGNTVYEEVR